MTGRNPVKGGVGGEGDLGEKEEEAEPHPWVSVARRERDGGGRAAVDSETAAKALVGGVLQWWSEGGLRPESCAMSSRSYWRG